MTKKIPEWSANITANAPDDWRAAFGRKAVELGISTGELLRQLWLAGAAARFPDLAEKLAAAHKRYYPKRCLHTATIMGLLFGFTLGGLGVHRDLRRVKPVSRTACVRNVRWQGAATA